MLKGNLVSVKLRVKRRVKGNACHIIGRRGEGGRGRATRKENGRKRKKKLPWDVGLKMKTHQGWRGRFWNGIQEDRRICNPSLSFAKQPRPCVRPQTSDESDQASSGILSPKKWHRRVSLRPGQSLPRTKLPNLKTLPPKQPTENRTCRQKPLSNVKPWLSKCAATNWIISFVSVVIPHHPSSTHKTKTRPSFRTCQYPLE